MRLAGSHSSHDRLCAAAKCAMPIEVVSQQASTVDDILKREVAILKPNAGRCGNLIKTSRFNLLSFVPITLYELLHPWKRFANFYFLCVGAMQMVPVITLTDGNPSTWMTLSFLVLVDMVVMAAEDMSRHKADRETNTQKVRANHRRQRARARPPRNSPPTPAPPPPHRWTFCARRTARATSGCG